VREAPAPSFLFSLFSLLFSLFSLLNSAGIEWVLPPPRFWQDSALLRWPLAMSHQDDVLPFARTKPAMPVGERAFGDGLDSVDGFAGEHALLDVAREEQEIEELGHGVRV
jgi:hypothetical protein